MEETNYKSSLSPFGIKMVDRVSGRPLHIDISDWPMKKGITTNRNKFILGPSGSGKSFFTNHMVRQYYEQGAHVLLVDTGTSYLGLSQLIHSRTHGEDGIYFTYTNENPIVFNPFYVEDGVFNIKKKESIINNSDCKILLDQRKYLNKFDSIQNLLGLTDKERSQMLSINMANYPGRKYKEVPFSLGGTQSAVYATEVSLEEYYTTEESEKMELFALADKIAFNYYKDLAEKGYYNRIISGNVKQTVEIDSVKCDFDQYPYKVNTYALQLIVRESSLTVRSLVSSCRLLNAIRSDNNPHSFIIEAFTITENKDLQTIKK